MKTRERRNKCNRNTTWSKYKKSKILPLSSVGKCIC